MPTFVSSLSANDLRTLPKEKTVVFFSIGPMEDHGPHLPLVLDLDIANALAKEIATQLEKNQPEWKGLLFSAVPLGIDTATRDVALPVRAHVLRDYLVDVSKNLVRQGFRYFVCVTGHPGPRTLTAIEEAGKLLHRSTLWRRKHPVYLLSANSALISSNEVLRSPFLSRPEEHGGRLDTSLGLALNSKHTSHSYLSLPALPKGQKSGYWGDPAKASAEDGTAKIQKDAEKIFELLLPILNGRRPRSEFRSWYSIIPTNWSFFRAWMFLIAIFLILMAWVYLSLRGIPA